MATVDKAISDLTAAAELLSNDLLVVEQGGQPKKMSGLVLMNYLLKNIDGHGGIQDVQHVSTVGLVNTYALIMADGEKLTFTVKDGEQGPPGQSDHIWLKWASTNPEEDANATLSDIPDSWVGIYTGILEVAPTKASSYKWFKWQGPQGDVGLTPQLRIGTVTTTPYDEPASASISGSVENPVLNLRIPEGRPGVDGKYSSDWSENYSGNPGYVLNRTHHVEEDEKFCFSAEVEISTGNTYFSFSGVSEVGYGDIYNVRFNKTVYRCQSQDIIALLGTHAPALGNLHLYSSEFEDTGEPFVFFVTGSECTLRAPDYANQTIGLQVMKAEVVKKLDNKFLDAEWTATKMTNGVAGPILDYTISFTSDNAIVNKIANAGILKGGKYTVTWGGTVYECTGIADYDGAIYLGAPKLAGWQVEGGNPEAPFCFVSFGAAALVYKTTATAEDIAVKIVGHRETSLKKIPPEFLPEINGSGVEVTAKPGQMIRVKSVDETGKPTAWEPVPWGWVEQGEMVEILPECQPTYYADSQAFVIDAVIPAEVGKTYTVNWNGVEYTATAIDGATLDLPPCPTIINDGANMDTGEGAVFIICCGGNDGNTYFAVPADGSTSVTLSISGGGETIHPIPGKLLPEGVPYVEKGGMVEILPETTLTTESPGEFSIPENAPVLEIGKSYTVKLNGTEYATVTIDSADVGTSGGVVVANEGANITTGEGAVFVLFYHDGTLALMEMSGSTSLTISIFEEGAIIHKIDPRCLPDSEPVEPAIFWVTGSFAGSVDHTLDEVGEAFMQGKAVWFRNDGCTMVAPCIYYEAGVYALFYRYDGSAHAYYKLRPDGTFNT